MNGAGEAKVMGRKDVFISHAKEDREIAQRICRALESAGIECWIAPRDIVPGMDFVGSIMDAISVSKVFLLLFSSSSNASKHVIRELENAVNKDLMILPVKIEDVALATSFEYFISTHQWLRASKCPLNETVRDIVDATQNLLRKEGEPGGLRREVEAEPEGKGVVGRVEASLPPLGIEEGEGERRKPTLKSQSWIVLTSPLRHLRRNRGDLSHVILSTMLLFSLYLIEALFLRFSFPDSRISPLEAGLLVTAVSLLGPFSVAFTYLFPYVLLPQRRRCSWLASIVVLSFSHLLIAALLWRICHKGVMGYAKGLEWPVPLIIGKDVTIFWGYSVLYLSNIWNHVHALRRASPEDRGELPTAVIGLPIIVYGAITVIVILALLSFDLLSHTGINPAFPGASTIITFSIVRDMLFVFALTELFIWYYGQLRRR